MLQATWWKNSHLPVILLFGFCLFFKLGGTPIYILDEARNAQCAWEMQQKHDYIVPLFNDGLRSEKPPLHYYFMMVAYALFGKTAFAARFFSAVVGLCTLLVTYLFTKKFLGDKLALYSVCVLGLSAHFLFEFRLSVPDPYLIFFQALTLFCLYGFSQRQKSGWLYAAGLFAAFSTLAKGPVAVVLPALIFVIFLATSRQLKLLLSWHWAGCFILYLLIAAPWFLLVHDATAGEFTRLFFLEQNLGRYGAAMEGHNNFPGLPLLIIIIGLLPASVLLLARKNGYKSLWQNSFTRFALIVCAVTVLFYSFSATMLPNYPMVCYPFAAIVIAFMFLQVQKTRPYLLGLSVVYVLLAVAGFFALQSEPGLDKNTRYWSLVLMLPAIVLVATAWLPAGNKRYAFLVGGFTVFNCLGLSFAYPFIYKQNPVTKNLSLIQQKTKVGSFGVYNPAINFYIDGPVSPLQDSAGIVSFLAQNRDALLIGRKSDLNKLDNLPVKLVAEQRDLFETPTTVLLSAADSLFHVVPKE